MKKVLFVCLGNICRSPAAEAIFKAKVEKAGLGSQFEIDSAGTSAYHEGEPADGRMQNFSENRGYKLTSLSRPFLHPMDFDHFDHIIVMDKQNLRNVNVLSSNESHLAKVTEMTSYCKIHDISEVPDPYHKGDEGFELVLDILEDACDNLLAEIQKTL